MQVRDDISKRNVFISWTESDKEIKNKICKRLIKGGVTVLESKEECSGDFEEWSKCAAVSASVFILILTENLIDKKTSYVKDEVREWRKATGDNFANRIIIVCPKYKITEKFVDENNQPVIGEDVKVSCIEYGENGVDDNVLNEIYNKTVMRIVGRMRAVYFTKSSKVSSIDISRMLGINQNDITYQFAEYNDLYITRTINCEGENYKEINSLLSKDDTKILFVTAPGGSGKSCYISQIFKELGQSDSEEDSLVFSISCVDASKELNKRKTEDKSDYSILLDILRKQFIKECGIGESYYTEENFLTLLNNSKKIVVVFDALDEVPNAGLVKKLAKAIVDLSKYGEDKIDIIITDRTDINRNLFRGAKIAKLNSFNDEDISQYCKSISRYLKNADLNEIIINDVDNAEVLEKINNTEDDVKRNPLMLTQILLLYAFTGEIKTGVVEILNSIVEIMFKSENRKELFGIDDKVPKNLLEILSAFAYERHICIVEGKKMSKKKVERIFDRLLNIKYVNLDQASLSELLKILFKSMARKFISVFGKIQQRVDGIGNLTKDIVRGEDLTDYLEYRSFYDAEKDAFCHARYGEYFVARYYCNAIFDEDGNIVNKDKLIELLSHCGNYYWKDIINYFVQLSGIAEIVIPENVTRLCGGLFSNCSKLKRVVLNKNIINIPEKAFYNCVSLEEIHTDNKNINSVKAYAFSGCEKLNKFESLSNVKTIGENAFYGCKGLKEVALNNVKTLGNDAFLGCSNVEKVKIPGGLIKIGERAFSGCSSVVEINISEGVESIGRLAFDECSALKEIVLPDSIKSIEYAAFSSCCSLEKVTLPSKLTEIADWLFSECISLSQVNFPDGLLSIGDSSFNGCSALSEIILPDKTKKLGAGAFSKCNGLKFAILPSSIEYVGGNAFFESKIAKIYIEGSHDISLWAVNWNKENRRVIYGFEKYVINDGIIYGIKENFAVVLEQPGETEASVELLDFVIWKDKIYIVKVIADNAFSWKKNLTNIVISGNIEKIGDNAFSHCSLLRNVDFGQHSRLKSIGEDAFCDCSSLDKMVLPESIVSVGENAFGCCNRLSILYCEATEKSVVCGYNWNHNDYHGKKRCPVVWNCKHNDIADDGFVYYVADNGIRYAIKEGVAVIIQQSEFVRGDIVIPAFIRYKGEDFCVEKINHDAFRFCELLKSISIPESVKSIGDHAFSGCKLLSRVIFAENSALESIGCYAFYDCLELTRIFIPENVSYIGKGAFDTCQSLVAIDVDNNNKYYTSMEGVLYNKEISELIKYPIAKIQDVFIMPDSVVRIYSNALVHVKFRKIGLSRSLIYLESIAFCWCDNLTEIYIPENVKHIGDYVFAGCPLLKEIIVDEKNQSFRSIEGNLYSKDGKKLVRYAIGKQVEKFHVPEGVRIIAVGAILGAKHLKKIDLPLGLIEINKQAIDGCSGLSSITVPATTTYIGYWGFENTVTVDIESDKFLKVWGGESGISCSKKDKVFKCNGLCVKKSKINNITSNENFDYVVHDGKAVLTKYKGNEREVIIPSTIDGYSVVSFGSAFSKKIDFKDTEDNLRKIKKIVIPSTVEVIGPCSFNACKELVSIEVDKNNLCFSALDGNLYNKDKSVFISYATGKADVSFSVPDGVKEIYPFAFYGNASLREIILPQGLNSIGHHAFECCWFLRYTVIPESVEHIGEQAFNNNAIRIIPCEAKCEPGQWGFDVFPYDCLTVWDCKNNNVASDGNIYIEFNGMRYRIKDGAASVAEQYKEKVEENVVIPAFVKYEGMDIPVKGIDSYAFAYCKALNLITIPDSIDIVGKYVFQDSTGLIIYCESEKPKCGYSRYWNMNKSYYYNREKNEQIPVVWNCRYNDRAQDGYIHYRKDGIKYVIKDDFATVTNIKTNGQTVKIPDKIDFKGQVYNVRNIRASALKNSYTVKEIIIPASVTSMDSFMFGESGVFMVYCEAERKPVGWDKNWNFKGCPVVWNCKNNEVADDGYIYTVVDGIRYALKEDQATFAKQISKISGDIAIPDSITYKDKIYSVINIDSEAFDGCSSLASVSIPESVTSIGSDSFSNCTSLTSVSIPESVTSIGSGSFSNCTSLTIYCEAESQPAGWSFNWNPDDRPVVWGYKGD